jgi:hypothetical protein
MKAGDEVYDHEPYPETRGELVEFLCDAIEQALGPEDTDRLTNGQVADTLFRFLDLAVVTEEQRAALRAFLKRHAAGEFED